MGRAVGTSQEEENAKFFEDCQEIDAKGEPVVDTKPFTKEAFESLHRQINSTPTPNPYHKPKIHALKNVSFRALDDHEVDARDLHLQFYECELCLARWGFDVFTSDKAKWAHLAQHNNNCFVYKASLAVQEQQKRELKSEFFANPREQRASWSVATEPMMLDGVAVDIGDKIFIKDPFPQFVEAAERLERGDLVCVDSTGKLVKAVPGRVPDNAVIMGRMASNTELMTDPNLPLVKVQQPKSQDDFMDAMTYSAISLGRQMGKTGVISEFFKDFVKTEVRRDQKAFEREYLGMFVDECGSTSPNANGDVFDWGGSPDIIGGPAKRPK